MNKYYELTIKHLPRNSKFINCSISNGIGIIQTDLMMRGLDIPKITPPVFMDMVYNRDCLRNDLRELITNGDIIIRPI